MVDDVQNFNNTYCTPLNYCSNTGRCVVNLEKFGTVQESSSITDEKALDTQLESLLEVMGRKNIRANFQFDGGSHCIKLSPSKIVALKNVYSGKVLDIMGGTIQKGVPIIQWPTHGGTNQKFEIICVSPMNFN